MKTPSEPGLIDYFDTATTTLAFDLYTIRLMNGQVVQITNADRPIMLTDGRIFTKGPIIERSRVSWSRGVQTSTLDVTMMGDQTTMIAGLPLVQFATIDGFTGASVLLERLYIDDQTLAQRGTLKWFVGTIGDVDPNRYLVKFTVRDNVTALNVMMPRDLYQPGCLNTLFDVRCGLRDVDWSVTLSVASIDPNNTGGFVRAAYGGQPSGWFALGRFKFTSGANAGLSRTAKYHANYGAYSDWVFARPFPRPITVGDGFIAFAGCDKSMSTCDGKFHNLLSNTGTPFVPDATTTT